MNFETQTLLARRVFLIRLVKVWASGRHGQAKQMVRISSFFSLNFVLGFAQFMEE